MAICGSSHAMPIPSLRVMLSVAVAAVVLDGCASATVGDVATHDGSPPATGGSGNGGKGGSGGSAGSGGAAGNGGATGGNGGSSGICDPIANTGCNAGQKCTALQSNGGLSLACDSKGSKAEGDTCAQTLSGSTETDDDCGSGLACFKAPTENVTKCHRICPLSGSTCGCGPNQLCSLTVAPLNNDGYAFCRAAVTCKPLEQTGCDMGQACYFSTSSCYTGSLCAQAGSKKPGESCAAANDCQTGSTCLLVGNGGICSAFCSTASGGTPTCSGASTGGSTCAVLGGPSDEPNLGSCRS